YVWLAALASVMPRLNSGRAKELTIFLLIATGIAQVAWSFFIWQGIGDPQGFHYGTFYAPNQYAGYIGMVAPLVLVPFFVSRNPLRVFLWGFLGAFVYLGIFLTGSRAGLGAAAAGALITGGIAARKSPRLTAIKAAGLIAILIALSLGVRPLIFPDKVSFGSSSATESGQKNRIDDSLKFRFLWAEAAVRSGLDRPLSGAGPGTFGMRMFKFQGPQASWARAAHNQYLEAWSDGGVLLFLGILILPLMVIWKVGSRWDFVDIDPTSQWDAGLLGGLATGSVHMLFDTDWSFPAFAAVFVILVALLAARLREISFAAKPIRLVSAVIASATLIGVAAGLAAPELRGSSDGATAARRASLLKPYSAEPHEFLANRDVPTDDKDALAPARASIQKAIRVKQIEPSLWWRLAEIEAMLGRPDAARSAYRHAQKIGPHAVRLYLVWSTFELEQGDPRRAEFLAQRGLNLIKARLDEARLISTKALLLIARARAEIALGDGEAAVGSAVEATKTAPGIGDIWQGLAEIACATGDPARAAEASENAVKLGVPTDQIAKC
ncbi:MAG TPA: O-antigen ligase family protein, partial [Actinomycetota bacterium]|nr:O-antigen ligase family protein [Actinomycetota bacterium]